MQEKISDIQTSRDALLRRIGRNVVNFQYLEALLREMIPSLSSETTQSTLHSHKAEINRKYKKWSLGDLTDTFLDSIFYSTKKEDSEISEKVNELSIKTTFQIEIDPQDTIERRKGLLKLVVERNRLIHRDVLDIDLNSDEQCEVLSKRLDEQNDRIRENLMFLSSLRNVQQEVYAEIAKYMQTDEFISAIIGQQDYDKS